MTHLRLVTSKSSNLSRSPIALVRAAILRRLPDDLERDSDDDAEVAWRISAALMALINEEVDGLSHEEIAYLRSRGLLPPWLFAMSASHRSDQAKTS